MGLNCGKRVLMAMSGGVDSSVAALVLRDGGYDVEGVTMRLFDNEDACLVDEKSCCSLKDAEDARQVCLEIGIPHIVYNFSQTFNEDVVDRFCNGYLSGQKQRTAGKLAADFVLFHELRDGARGKLACRPCGKYGITARVGDQKVHRNLGTLHFAGNNEIGKGKVNGGRADGFGTGTV